MALVSTYSAFGFAFTLTRFMHLTAVEALDHFVFDRAGVGFSGCARVFLPGLSF